MGAVKEINGLDVTEITEFYGVDRGKIAEYNGIGMEVWSSGLIADGSFSIKVKGKGTLDWGDGNSTAYDGSSITLTHTYSSFDGIIKFYGTLTEITSNVAGADLHHDIGLLPTNLNYYFVGGGSTAYGDVKNAPRGLHTLRHTGQYHNIVGDVADIPPNLYMLYMTKGTGLYGAISDIPDVSFFLLYESPVTGAMADFPTTATSIYWHNSGALTGSFSDAPPNARTLQLAGTNIQIDGYTSGHVFNSAITKVTLTTKTGYGLDSTEIDNLLIDLESSGMSSGSVQLTGSNAPRTTASDVAVASLVAQGVTVTTNP